MEQNFHHGAGPPPRRKTIACLIGVPAKAPFRFRGKRSRSGMSEQRL